MVKAIFCQFSKGKIIQKELYYIKIYKIWFKIKDNYVKSMDYIYVLASLAQILVQVLCLIYVQALCLVWIIYFYMVSYFEKIIWII